ncbi:MAG: hypothetical protein WCS88_04490 [Patescibacteria group bacterium]|jgi:hypothetical protein
MKRYWIKRGSFAWQEVSRSEFAAAEKEAGFYPGPNDGDLVSNGFCSNSVADGTRITGRITNGEISKKKYGFDQEFLRIALQKK